MAVDSANTLARQLRGAAGLSDPGPTDAQLLDRFAADRDESAFAELVRRYGPMVLSACRRVAGNAADADDAFQATFLVLARKAHCLGGQPILGVWLHGVAHRAALKARATAARRRAMEAAAARPEGAGAMNDSSDVLTVIERELSQLPQKYREPLVLCALCGRPRKDVAEQLGVPEGTLASRMAKAREMLAERLRRRGLIIPAAVAMVATCDSPARAAVPSELVDATVSAATGTVPAAAARIASEVTRAMFLAKFRIAVFTLPAVLLFAAVAAHAARLGEPPGRNPEQKPMVATRPAVGAAPKDDTPAWKKEFNRVYALKDGEVVKRVAPPFPECRTEYARDRKYVDPDGPFTTDDLRMLLRWDGKQMGSAILTFTVKGPVPPTWFTVGDVLRFSAGPAVRVEGSPELLKAFAPGDFVVREGAPAEKVVPRLEAILRDECELGVKFRLDKIERDVVVVRGKFTSVPRAGREKNEIDVFSRWPIPETRAGGSSGDLVRFLLGVETFTRRQLINEVEGLPTDTLSWYFHLRSPTTAEEQAEDTDPEAVFKVIAAQTGLTFKTEKRKVPVILVEKAEK